MRLVNFTKVNILSTNQGNAFPRECLKYSLEVCMTVSPNWEINAPDENRQRSSIQNVVVL